MGQRLILKIKHFPKDDLLTHSKLKQWDQFRNYLPQAGKINAVPPWWFYSRSFLDTSWLKSINFDYSSLPSSGFVYPVLKNNLVSFKQGKHYSSCVKKFLKLFNINLDQKIPKHPISDCINKIREDIISFLSFICENLTSKKYLLKMFDRVRSLLGDRKFMKVKFILDKFHLRKNFKIKGFNPKYKSFDFAPITFIKNSVLKFEHYRVPSWEYAVCFKDLAKC